MKINKPMLLTPLMMDDRCKNKSEAYQLAFYKAGYKTEKSICLNTEQTDCNKFRINDLEWLLDKDIMELPDVLVTSNIPSMPQKILDFITDNNIKIVEVNGNLLDNVNYFEGVINSIEKKMYKAKTLKYEIREKKRIKDIEEKLMNRTTDMEQITNELISELLNMLKEKDLITYEHVTNVSNYIDVFLKGVPDDEKLSDEQIKHLKNAALVHDVGKLTIPNQILRKGESLSDNEYSDMKKHVEEDAYLFNNGLMEAYKDIALAHHERYDGTGYPYGLKGE